MLSFFFSTVQSDFPLALRLVEQITNHYPESPIIAISDGPIDGFHELGNVSERITLVEGESLKYCGSMGLFTSRNLQCALSLTDSSFLVKLDPDSFLVRRFRHVPDVDWAGEVNCGTFTWGYSSWCRGGGYCIKRESVQKILDSKLLLHSRYNVLQEFEMDKERIYEDCRLGHVANELGIYPERWKEVRCGGLSMAARRIRGKALIHPIKSECRTLFPVRTHKSISP